MAEIVLADRIRMSVASAPGTGTITLGAARPGFRSFADAGVGSGTTFPYAIEDGTAWEVGLGRYTTTPQPQFIRDEVHVSSNGSAAINASASADVFVTLTAIAFRRAFDTQSIASMTVADLTAGRLLGGAIATGSDYLSNATGKVLSPQTVINAASETPLPFASAFIPNLAEASNFVINATGNFTLVNFTGGFTGQSGHIRIVQDATGSRTIAYGTNFKKAATDSSALTTTPNATDLLFYYVVNSDFILYSLKKDIK